ncbi:MAG TPA: hypothetical protein ENN29_02170 [Candidatus Hydrogenedentes bacterium]|nr:hypothetical protein [Candidatus Hydrogenedentota bacterium]
MTIGMRRLAVMAVLLLLVAGIAGHAYGFFPRGGFNINQQLRYATWQFKEFDSNENGVIEQGEGLEFRIEGGRRGFTLDEIEQVKAGFKTWQDVPTAYAAFRFVGVIEDPIVPGTGSPDFLPTVFMQVSEVAENDGYSQLDDPSVIVTGMGGILPAVSLVLYTIDITAVPVGGNVVIVSAGTILDCDIVVDASLHRAGVIEGTTFGTLDLQATITQQVGYLLGLSPTPLNNLDPLNTITLPGASDGLPVEPVMIQMTGPDGIARMVGATPTMFPFYFMTQTASGDYVAGWRDLAPDDISGVSWLYPREDGLENFFSIQHEARTHVRRNTGIPPAPISGAHIVAWASIGDNDSGRRVPMFSTMTGLYQRYTDIQLSGMFNLMGLWKQMELPGQEGVLFEPSYVVTMGALNGLGYERQAPPNVSADIFDSIQGAFPLSYSTIVRPATEFSTNYPSEVFNEDGNVYGVDNYPAGTPLIWSFEKNAVVSADTNKTIPRMLPRNRPMFGDPDMVCPMNIIENPSGGTVPTDLGSLNNKLRDFRDNTLLNSALGTAVVELYYRAAPYVSYQLLRHDALLRAARGAVLLCLWIWQRIMMVLILGTLLTTVMYVMKKKNRMSPAGAAAALLALILCVAAVAGAGQVPVTTEKLVAGSTYIVSGRVLSAEGFQAQDGRIYTDVVFEVTDVAKGDVNRGSTLAFVVIGGRYGTLALAATGIPGFVEGEGAVLYLVDVPGYGLVPYGGLRSKIPIHIDPETEEEEVVVGEGEDDAATEGEEQSEEGETEGEEDEGENEEGEGEEGEVVDEDEGETEEGGSEKAARPVLLKSSRELASGRVPVRDYMRYLRAIANSRR